MSILKSKHSGYSADGIRTPFKGGGGLIGAVEIVVGVALVVASGGAAAILEGAALEGAAAIGTSIGVSLMIAGAMQVVSSLLLPTPAQTAGTGVTSYTKFTLPLATDNRIPVIYGTAWSKGVEVWGYANTGDTTAYYAVVFSEVVAGYANSLNYIYRDDCLLTLDGNGWVTNAVDASGNSISRYNGLFRVQYFANGMPSDRSVFDDIPWLRDSTNLMSNMTFAIFTVKYSASALTYDLGTIQASISNTLTDPGLVIADYMTNSLYGCNIATRYIDYPALTALSAWSNQSLAHTYLGTTYYANRYSINGIVDTSQNSLQNLTDLCQSAGCQPTYNTNDGKFSVFIDQPVATVSFAFSDDTLVGPVQITTQELASTPTGIRSTYQQARLGDGSIDQVYKGNQNTVYATENGALYPSTAPKNIQDIKHLYVDNNVQAQRLVDLALNQNLLDLTIQFRTTFQASGLRSGDLITITEASNGWVNKQFIILTITEAEDPSGNITINITAKDYSSAVYVDSVILSYNPSQDTTMGNPSTLSSYTPPAPFVSSISNTGISTFVLGYTIPTGYLIEDVAIYTAPTGSGNWSWLETVGATTTNGIFSPGINYQTLTLPNGDFDIAVRYGNYTSTSNQSTALTNFNWTNVVAASYVPSYLWSPTALVCLQNTVANTTTVGQTANLKLFMNGNIVTLWNGSGSQPTNTWTANSLSATNGYSVSGIVYDTANNDVGLTLTHANTLNTQSIITLGNITYLPTSGNIITLPTSSISVSELVIGQNGNSGAQGNRGFLPMGYVLTTQNPQNAPGNTTANLTAAFQSSPSGVTPPIGTGYTPIAGDTASFTAPLLAGQPSAVYTYNGTNWVSAYGTVIDGNLIVSGSINAGQMNVNTLYPINIVSTNANLGNLNSNGYWLQANTGNARFGGNISIGDNATIGNNLSVGGNVTIGNVITLGNLAPGSVGTTQIAANSITTGLIQANAITGNLIAGNTITSNNIVVGGIDGTRIANGTITTNQIAANYIYSGSIYGNQIAANSITASEISSNYVYSGDIVSYGATLGSDTGNGYWLQYNTGNAYIGGNLYIGNNLTVANLITTNALNANTVTTNSLVINSTVQSSTSMETGATQLVNWYNNATYWPNNTRGFVNSGPAGVGGMVAVGLVPVTTGTSTGPHIIVSYSVGVSAPTNSQYNLVELWRSGASKYYSEIYLGSVGALAEPGQSLHAYDIFYVVGSNGATYASSDSGATWYTATNNSNKGYNFATVWGDCNTLYWPFYGQNGYYRYGFGTASTVNAAVSSVAPNVYGSIMVEGVAGYPGAIIVGQNGYISKVVDNTGTPGTPGTSGIAASSTINDLYAINIDRAPSSSTGSAWTCVIVGAFGTILVGNMTHPGAGFANIGSWTQEAAPTGYHLRSVWCSTSTQVGSGGGLWVAVGDQGTICYSYSGTSWATTTSPTINNLQSVAYGNGYWVAVGLNGTICYSTDGITWSSYTMPIPATDGNIRNLYTVTFGPATNTFIIGGESIIMKSTNPTASANWTTTKDLGTAQSSALTRLAYWGSQANVANVSAPNSGTAINNQTVSGFYTDVSYTAGNEVIYYVVVGNMNGSAVYAQTAAITATEYKR